ncbi:MAG TPA: pyridoxal phosphate-dependent aminotransferase [Alphaproteobacteria bacterium]|nr:pyridoxal phosphate-dependent aminotransferase [Alphaproteobacteria bacterium]
MVTFARRMERLGTETAFEVLARAKALEARGREILHFEIGEPDFDTPAHIKEAAIQALRDGHTHYGPSPGLPVLREAIAEAVSKSRGIAVSPEEVIVTPGAKPIMFFTLLALAQPGDEVIYPNPSFPIYESMINFVGATPVPIPLLESVGFSFDMERFEASLSPRTKLIILNSPGNPTGGVIPAGDLQRIAAVALDRGITVLSDEIYIGMQYDGTPLSIASLPGMQEQTIILDGFSKLYAMTGWRLGFGVANRQIIEQFTKLMANSASCTASFVQLAGVAALRGPQTPSQQMVAEFKRRRDLIVQGMNDLPAVHCALPQGAFYVFPNIQATGRSSAELATQLLNEAGIACLAGTAFGHYGEGYLRFSYASSEDNIRKMLIILRQFLKDLPR